MCWHLHLWVRPSGDKYGTFMHDPHSGTTLRWLSQHLHAWPPGMTPTQVGPSGDRYSTSMYDPHSGRTLRWQIQHLHVWPSLWYDPQVTDTAPPCMTLTLVQPSGDGYSTSRHDPHSGTTLRWQIRHLHVWPPLRYDPQVTDTGANQYFRQVSYSELLIVSHNKLPRPRQPFISRYESIYLHDRNCLKSTVLDIDVLFLSYDVTGWPTVNLVLFLPCQFTKTL